MKKNDSYNEGIKNILSKMYIKQTDITPSTRFRKELAMDSIDMADFAFRVELEYGVHIPDAQISEIESVQDLVCLIENDKLKKKE